jgi:hypothetical protein
VSDDRNSHDQHNDWDPYLDRTVDDPEGADDVEPDPVLDDPELTAELDPRADPRPEKRGKRQPKINWTRTAEFTGTPRDYEEVRIIVDEQVRREHPDWPEHAIQREAERRYRELCSIRHPKLPIEYLKLMQTSWSPERRDIRENIESYAMRQLPEAKRLEEVLSYSRMGPSASS